MLLVTGNTTSLQNPDFNITGNLTLSTMSIENVEAPVGIANVTTNIPTSGTYVVQPLELSDGQGSYTSPSSTILRPPIPAGPGSL